MKILRETPYAFALTPEASAIMCSHCLKQERHMEGKLQICSRCKFSKYCSKACQKEDYINHKEQCQLLKKVEPSLPGSFQRLVAQIVIKGAQEKAKGLAHQTCNLAQKYDEDGNTSPVDGTRTVASLVSQIDNACLMNILIDRENLVETIDYISLLTDIVDAKTAAHIPTSDELTEIYCAAKMNATSVFGMRGHHIGHGLYLNQSAVKHSCVPNCCYSFDGQDITLYSIGQDHTSLTWTPDPQHLTASYIQQPLVRTDMRSRLLYTEKRIFTCHCAGCLDTGRELEMTSLVCLTCKTGIAKPDHIPPKPLSKYTSHDPEILYKCGDPKCGATHNLVEYEPYRQQLSFILEHLGQHSRDGTHLKDIITKYANLKRVYLPPLNVLRSEIGHGIYNLRHDNWSVNNDVSVEIDVVKDGLELYRHYFKPGFQHEMMSCSFLVTMLERKIDKMKETKPNAWNTPRFIRLVADAVTYAQQLRINMETYYGGDHNLNVSVMRSFINLREHVQWIVQKQEERKKGHVKAAWHPIDQHWFETLLANMEYWAK